METTTGILQLHPKGFGFLRLQKNKYFSNPADPFVSHNIIKEYKLADGFELECKLGEPNPKSQGTPVEEVVKIEGEEASAFKILQRFDNIISVDPHEQLVLETEQSSTTARIIDLITPLGKGQRAMIVSPPRAGKTTILKDIAHGISTNHPECEMIILLVDERPEEVTDMQRSVAGKVYASSSDREGTDHTQLANLVFARCKRLLEMGKDVVLLLDSLTRLARTFNMFSDSSGRTLSGGLDSRAMEKPKRYFGSARKAEKGGSLTIVATALIETGSRMDQLIFEEFKGTGNMELVLDRKIAEQRMWPAIHVGKSGTRKEFNILPKQTMEKVNLLRRLLAGCHEEDAMKLLLNKINATESNEAFLKELQQ